MRWSPESGGSSLERGWPRDWFNYYFSAGMCAEGLTLPDTWGRVRLLHHFDPASRLRRIGESQLVACSVPNGRRSSPRGELAVMTQRLSESQQVSARPLPTL